MIERLDKFLASAGLGSRSDVKLLLKKGLVTINGEIIKRPEQKINTEKDTVTYQGNVMSNQKLFYYMLHKPVGYVSAKIDNTAPTVISLLKEDVREDLFPVGRLDKDTEGLLLITNDGALSHRLLSPKYHVEKTYLVTIPQKLVLEQIQALEEGVDIGDESITRPAKVTVLEERQIHLTITEGRFHQVKRMLHAVGSEVLYLKRVSFGTLKLDETLPLGEYRALTEEEVKTLC
ncbi:MAG: pseudouridine synthase [Lachnospiraceae bacterium]